MRRGATEFKMNTANYSLNSSAILEKSGKGIELGKIAANMYEWLKGRQ